MSHDIYDDIILAVSWDLVNQERRCPPAEHLLTDKGVPELQEHLRFCPTCRKRLDMDKSKDPFEALTDIFNSDKLPSAPTPKAGQLWLVDETKGGWDSDGFYYNSPVVMILEILPYHVVRVAQFSHYLAFAGEDDVRTDGFYDGFVEPWNIYSLPIGWLERCIGNVGEKIVIRTREAHEKKIQNSSPPDMTGYGTPLDLFRQLELTHSVHFSMPAIGEVMRLMEAQAVPPYTQDVNPKLPKRLRGISLPKHFVHVGGKKSNALLYPMAAKDSTEILIIRTSCGALITVDVDYGAGVASCVADGLDNPVLLLFSDAERGVPLSVLDKAVFGMCCLTPEVFKVVTRVDMTDCLSIAVDIFIETTEA